MFFVFGTAGSTSSINTGEFFCPECNEYKKYDHKKVQKKISLFFVPLIPIEDLGDYVECQDCKSTFKKSVLDHDPKAEEEKIRSLYYFGTLDIMISIARADGVLLPEEITEIRNNFESIIGSEVSEEFVNEQLEKSKETNYSPVQVAGALAAHLNDVGKERVLRGAIAISKADGVIQNEELVMLHDISKALLLPKTYANGIFGEEGVKLL